MACSNQENVGNFLRSISITENNTLADLQANGIPSDCSLVSVTPNVNNVVFFDGINDRLQVTGNKLTLGDNSTPDNDFTIMWVMKSNLVSGTKSGGILIADAELFGTCNFENFVSVASNQIKISVVIRGSAAQYTRTQSETQFNSIDVTIPHVIAYDKIGRDSIDHKIRIDGDSAISVGSPFDTMDTGDVVSFENIQIGNNSSTSGYEYDGVYGKMMIFQPPLTNSQYTYLYNGDARDVLDPTTIEAKSNGIGVDGVDIIGVDGITTLVKWFMENDESFENAGNYYLRESVSNNNNYALAVNYLDAENDLITDL